MRNFFGEENNFILLAKMRKFSVFVIFANHSTDLNVSRWELNISTAASANFCKMFSDGLIIGSYYVTPHRHIRN